MIKAHTPVLLNEVISIFDGMSIKTFVDCTLGAGGHAEAILTAHPEIMQWVGIDQDPTACDLARKRLEPWQEKISIALGNFRHLDDILRKLSIASVDGILMDLGVSSMQLDQPEKGFSFMHEGPLDMRMNPNNPLTAEMIVNEWSEHEIGRILRDYGEEKQWRKAAHAITNARTRQPIRTTKDLVNILYPVLMHRAKKGLNPLTLVFQGLRIFLNDELGALQAALPQALKFLQPKGRLAVISFHSLEDRIVKQMFQYESSDKESTSGLGGLFLDKKPTVRILTKKPIVPESVEKTINPRSSSAKLRAFEKI
jgi:16S rRNA (cytosine1402-N4)-methyltransferase